MADNQQKIPFHEQVAAEIIQALENGTAPWIMPWKPGTLPSPPINALTGKAYRGINYLRLGMLQYASGSEDPRWCTYKQAQELGAQVQKGAHGVLVQYWKQTDRKLLRDEQGKPVLDAQGEKCYEETLLEYPKVFHAVVFHASQIENLPPLPPKPKPTPEMVFERHERSEKLLTASGAKILHDQLNRAFYRPGTDEIHLPKKEQFHTPDGYYATALHELGHWTGHESRLNRELLKNPFGSNEYAREELRAEIASYMLGMELDIGHDPGQHQAYVASWVEQLKKDPKEIIRAARDADQIKEYVLKLEREREQETAQEREAEYAEEYSATSVKPWRADFPKLFAHTTIAAMKKHPDYQAAKNGDTQAAERFVADMVKPERVRELAQRYPNAIVVPVTEFESTGRYNAIPRALANYIAKEGGLRLDADIIQTSAQHRGDKDAVGRLLTRKEFAGEVQQGATYIMVDDVATQGGTFHELRHYLANNGAEAIAASSLAFSRGNNIIPIQENTVNELEGRFGREQLEQFLEDNNISGTLEALTEGEGRALCRFSSFESLSNRVAEATSARAELQLSEEVRPGTPDYRLIQAVFGEEATRPLAPALTTADLAAVFPNAHITPSNIPGTDSFTVKAGNVAFSVRSCERISPDESVFRLAYGRDLQAGEHIAGAVQNGEILIAHIGDKNTLRHESYHLLEDMGLVTPKEQQILNQAAAKAIAENRLPGASASFSPEEQRAWYVEHQLAQREFDQNTPTGTILQKAVDFVDALGNLARRTERGILRDLESGKMFTREPDQANPQATHYAASQPEPAQEKTYLYVPYKEKDAAKAAGAKWDMKTKSWYAPVGTDLQPLRKWMPENNRQVQPDLGVLDPRGEFGNKLSDAGLVIDGEPVLDGKIQRVPVVGGRPGAKDGAYCGHMDGHPNGWYQNHKTGEQGKWSYSALVLTKEARETLHQDAAEKLKAREVERKTAQDKAMRRAYAVWMNAEPASPEHPYLAKKGVEAYGLRQDKHGNLLVPGYDEKGLIKTLQYINKDGAKWYEKGCPKQSAMAILPDKDAMKTGEVVLMAEGYATGASIHRATGLPVAVAFDAGNLKDAVLAIKKKYPNVQITICADNDAHLSDAKNVGLIKAKEAANVAGCKYVVANFSPDEQKRGLTDFNDLHKAHGLDAVKKNIMAKVNERPVFAKSDDLER